MYAKAILCEAAEAATGRLYALGGYGSERLYGPRRGLGGMVAGIVFDVPDARVGERIRLAAQLGTSDHFERRSWKAVRLGGRPVRVSSSIVAEGPAVPFAIELPSVDLGRGAHTWKLTLAGTELLLPGHYDLSHGGDVDPTPEGELFLCETATVAEGRLQLFGARPDSLLVSGRACGWALAGRLSVPATRDMPVHSWELQATLRRGGNPVGAEVHHEVEVRRPARARGDWLLVEVPLALRLPPVDLTPGDYGWEVVAGGDIIEFVQFTVRT